MLSVTSPLSIFIDGEAVSIPANIGVDSSGDVASVYTSASDGILRVDDASAGSATLGDFFDIWRTDARLAGNNSAAMFDAGQILGYSADGTYFIQMFVNGVASQKFDEYVLQDGDKIVIAYTSNEIVSLNTNLGSILIELYKDETPGTVDNFLNYVNDGDYNNSIFHRSVADFVIQGGGYTTPYTYFYSTSQFSEVPEDATIQNEPGISNTRGTVAMAKLSGDANSATSQFFINLGDNSSLDSEAYGAFTVFGRVLDMATVDAIAALTIDTSNASPFGELPLTSEDELVVVESLSGEGTVSGLVFEDLDRDGVQSSGEEGISGATVFADANGNGELDDGEYSTTTGDDGGYRLRLPAGSYTIRQRPVAGLYAATSDGTGTYSVTVEIGRESESADFANIDNAPPTGTADAYSVSEDGTLTITAASGVLANDSDAEDDSLSAVRVTGPAHGDLTLNSDGSFTYVPAADYFGSDSFMYYAEDAYGRSDAVTVTLTVNPVADPPAAVADTFTSPADGETKTLDVLNNDSDPDGAGSLTITAVSQGSLGGDVSISDDGSAIEYTPVSGASGTETFAYTVQNEDGLTAEATVAVVLNDSTSSGNGSAVISGHVYIDSNGNGQWDSGDFGIRRVLITLTGTDNASSTVNRSVLTASDGSYSFNNLAPGTYRITQTQPAAMLDGTGAAGTLGGTVSGNSISNIVLAAGQSSTGNDFSEQGLRLQYISKRMFLASARPLDNYLLDAMVRAEEAAGNTNLARWMRNGVIDGSSDDGDDDEGTPVAVNDAYSVNEDETLVVGVAMGVLANDSDPDGDALTAELVSNPSHGTLTLNVNGTFTYVPNANFHGTDSFTYRASDGGLNSNVATVTITVNPVNDAPVAVGDAYQTGRGQTLTVSAAQGVLANDTDVEGSTLTATLVSGPSHGMLTLNADGSFTYTPGSGFDGIDSFTYTASDGALTSNTATVTIEIEDPPVAMNDTYQTDEDTPLVVVAAEGVLANDTDLDGDTLVATLLAGPTHGTLTLNSDGSFTYIPDADFFGIDTFTYLAEDGRGGSGQATATIVVNGVNDAPIAAADSYRTAVNEMLSVPAASGVLANDTDVEGSTLSASLVIGPLHGSLTLSADGSFTYIPEPDFQGVDSFTYTASDGELISGTTTVTLAVNSLPVAGADSYETDEDTPLVVDAAGGVLANDSDADGDALTVSLASGPSHGSLTLNSDGSFTYAPEADFFGIDTFTYLVFDGIEYSAPATVSIVVAAVDDDPLAVDDSYRTAVNAALTVTAPSGVLANDSDAEGSSLIAILVSGPTHGTLALEEDGSFVYTPEADFRGVDSFTYMASDGTLTSGTATVVLTVNSLPQTAADSYVTNEDTILVANAAEGVLANDSDADGDTLTVRLAAGPSHGTLTLNPDGSFAYTPAANFFGTDSFTYVADDGLEDSAQTTVTITVNAMDDAPLAVDDSYRTAVGETLIVSAESGLLVNDSDDDGATLVASLLSNPTNGTLTLNSDGSFTYVPEVNFHGVDSFTYLASNGTLASNPATVTIRVNNLPDALDDSYETDEDTPLIVDAAEGVLANDTDPDGDALAAALVTGPLRGTLALNADGSFTYTPEANFFGTDSFTYLAEDSLGDSVQRTVTIVVNAVDDAPAAVADNYRTSVDQALSVPADAGVLVNDSDPEGSDLTAVLESGPAHGTLSFHDDGSFLYTPEDGFRGIDSFTYTVSDGALASAAATVTLTVNTLPATSPDSYTIDEDTELVIDLANGLLANDTDADGDALTVALAAGPTRGSLTLNSDGSFTYTPEAGFVGTDAFFYFALDGLESSGETAVTITVGAQQAALSSSQLTDQALADEDDWLAQV